MNRTNLSRTALISCAVLILIFLIWGNIVWDRKNDKRCYDAVLPSLKLCLPRSYFTFKNFDKADKVGYDWTTFFLPVSNEVEGGNQLTLLIPRSTLQVLPPKYDEGNDGMVTISLRPLNVTPEERQNQFEHFQGKNVFIHCDYHDNERGTPTGKQYCQIKMDWDANIKNPRIELSFSIAPADFNRWQINAKRVRTFLLSFAVNHSNSLNQSRI